MTCPFWIAHRNNTSRKFTSTGCVPEPAGLHKSNSPDRLFLMSIPAIREPGKVSEFRRSALRNAACLENLTIGAAVYSTRCRIIDPLLATSNRGR